MLSIRNPELETLARRLAKERKMSMTEVILDALRRDAAGLDLSVEKRKILLRDIASECQAAPDLDLRPANEILGYGETGVFENGSR